MGPCRIAYLSQSVKARIAATPGAAMDLTVAESAARRVLVRHGIFLLDPDPLTNENTAASPVDVKDSATSPAGGGSPFMAGRWQFGAIASKLA